jgi:hypothetical protein
VDSLIALCKTHKIFSSTLCNVSFLPLSGNVEEVNPTTRQTTKAANGNVTTMPEKKTTEIIVTVSWVNDQFNCVGYN